MSSVASKTMPFLVIAIVIATLGAEAIYDIEVDLEQYLPLLVPLGLGGLAKSALTKAIEVKNGLPESHKEKLKEQIKKLQEKYDAST